jgi:ATP-dependent helicase/nuclease subunit A
MSAYDLAQTNQRAAADPNANVFVTANAGSGKTKVLIDRIARLLLAGAPPASFLCITYTKAAAAEMQRRLFERLGTWCVADDAALRKALTDLAGPDAQVADEMLPRARALFAQALETPGGLKIQTIHAFCERLLGRFPLEAGAPPGFEVADEPRAALLMRNARNRLCEGDDETVARAFARFAGRLDADRLDRLLAELAARNLSDATHIHARHGSQRDGAEIIASAIAETPWRDLAAAADRLASSGAQDQACAERIRIARGLSDTPDECWRAYLEVFLTQAGKPRANVVTAGFGRDEPGIKRLLDDEFQRVLDTRDAFLAAERAADSAAAYAIAACLAAAYKDEKRRAGLLDFADLIVQARALLTQSDAAPWVLYKLDGGIDHILVDEGQDTSPDQWELIGPLRDEFFAGAGARSMVQRTMFAVGDPKQSIYSFQGADPRYFLAERQTLASRAHDAERVFVAPNLGMSFRATKQVLNTVDKVFDGKDLAGGAPEAFDIVKHDVSRAKEGGVVEIWPFLKRPVVTETRAWDAPLDMESALTAPVLLAKHIARAVKGWIDEGQAVWDDGALRPMRGGDVMALVRTRGPVFEALIRAFKREGLTVAGADRMVLRNELAAEDCLALMRVALDPRDDLALACVLKGPWLNLTNDGKHRSLASRRAQLCFRNGRSRRRGCVLVPLLGAGAAG